MCSSDLSLGQPTAANADAYGEGFSPSLWATNWNKMSDDAKVVFKPSVRTDLNDLANVIEGVKNSGRMRNNSNTANALNVFHTMFKVGKFVVEGAALGSAVATGHGLASIPMSAGLGRAMVSPGVARAIAGRIEGRPSEWFANRLNGIAARSSPAIANTLRELIMADNPRHDIPNDEAAPWESFDAPIEESPVIDESVPTNDTGTIPSPDDYPMQEDTPMINPQIDPQDDPNIGG